MRSGRDRVDDRAQPLGQVAGLPLDRLPQVVAVEMLAGAAEPLRDRAARGHALQAVAVVGAAARVGVAGLAGHGDVSHLGVPEPRRRPAPDDRAGADPGADGHVDEGRQPLRRTPAALAERGARDVGVEADRHAQSRPDRADEVGVAPAGLGSGGDVPVVRVARSQLDGTERRDTHGRGRGRAGEERHDLGQRRLRVRSRGDAGAGLDVVGGGAEQADELRATGFHGAEARGCDLGHGAHRTGDRCRQNLRR